MGLGINSSRRNSGMFHVTLDPEGPGVIRLHLRRPEKKIWDIFKTPKSSMLWINGTQLLLLEDSAADIVQSLIEVIQENTKPGQEVSLEVWHKIRRETAHRVHSLYPQISVSQIEGYRLYLWTHVELSKEVSPRKGIEVKLLLRANGKHLPGSI